MAKAINTKTLVNVAKPDYSGLVTIIATGKAVSMKKDTEHKVTMTLAETLVNKGFATFKK